MNIGILGSGSVGQQLGLGFLRSGHEVKIGTGHPEKLRDWHKQAGEKASLGSFADAAAFGEMVVLATKWADNGTLRAIESAGRENFEGKTVIDVTNPLEFSAQGQPPKPALRYPDSGGALVQGWLPDSRVVKAFNIINAHFMANPNFEEGPPTLFICGDHKDANGRVAEIAAGWGWRDVIDIGGIHEAYLLEALAMLWIRYGFANNYWKHAFRLMRK